MIQNKCYTPAELGVTDTRITDKPSLRFYDVRETAEMSVHGLYDYKNGEQFKRLPDEVAEKVSDGVKELNFHTTGGRVRFMTDSDYIAVRTYHHHLIQTSNMTITGSSGFDVYVKRQGRDRFEGFLTPIRERKSTPYSHGDGVIDIITLPSGMKEITLFFPIFQTVDKLYIGLDSEKSLLPRADYKYKKPVLYYGSSITQGISASRPGMAYEAIISRNIDADYVNLGFGGRCLGEPAVADYIATLDPSVFVYDYDHNSTNFDHYRSTHEALYLKFREAHPDTPVIFVGRPDFWLDGYLNAWLAPGNREILHKTYQNALERGENVSYIDGYILFYREDREDCTADGVHTNDLGMQRMADIIGEYVLKALE